MHIRRRQLYSRFVAISVSLLFTLVFIWMMLTNNAFVREFVRRLDYIVYDLRLKISIPPIESVKNREFIRIIDIDEKSLSEQGRWPWSRKKMSELVTALQSLGVVVVAYDIIFSEREANIASLIYENMKKNNALNQEGDRILQEITHDFAHDSIFADTLKKGDNILGFIFDTARRDPSGVLPQPLYELNTDIEKTLSIRRVRTYTAPLAEFTDATHAAGFVTTFPDSDGVIRRTPIVLRYENKIYGSLALIAMAKYLLINDIKPIGVVTENKQNIEGVQIGDYIIPTDIYGQVLVPYIGPSRSFTTFSATDVMKHRIPKSELENTVVFIGSSALGLFDLKPTPIEQVYPGVEVHASVAAGILNKNFHVRPAWAKGADVTLVALLGLFLALILPFLSPVFMLVCSGLTLIFILVGDYWVWQHELLDLPISLSLMTLFTLGFSNITYGFLLERYNKRHIESMFSQYVPPAHIAELLQGDESQTGFAGDTREMTVLFMDIRNFTTISEGMNAGDLKKMLNLFFTEITDIIFKHNGTIDKYVGDMVMAFWGAPLHSDTHSIDGVMTALDVQQKIEELKPRFQELGYPEVRVGVGLNTGIMNVGDMGSVYRRNYTVLGDAVNLASRLEGISRYYKVTTIISEFCQAHTDEILCRRLDRIRVKGKKLPVTIFEPLCPITQAPIELLQEIAHYERGLESYFQQKWEDAKSIFTELLAAHPERYIYELYLTRCQELQTTPPESTWDGVYTFTNK